MAKRHRSPRSSSANSDSSTSESSRRGSKMMALKRKYEKVKKDLKRLERKMKSLVQERLRVEKKKKGRLSDQRIEEILETLDQKFTPITNDSGETLWLQAHSELQELLRELIDEVACRWAHWRHLPTLDFNTVKLRDNKPILPKPIHYSGPCINYALKFLDFILLLFGSEAENEENAVLQDFIKKLSDPDLNLLDFQNLYYHRLVQSHENITALPADAVSQLRNMKKVEYEGTPCGWEWAYQDWVTKRYNRQRIIDLESTCLQNPYAKEAYEYRANVQRKVYQDDLTSEADLVRNFITHFHQIYRKVHPTFQGTLDSKQVGEVVFNVFPHIFGDLYDFLYECRVNLNFRNSRKFYEDQGPDRWNPSQDDKDDKGINED